MLFPLGMHLVMEIPARLRLRCVQRVDHSTWRIYVLSNVLAEQHHATISSAYFWYTLT